MADNNSFGCPQCSPAAADEAWAAVREFDNVAHLVEESHFSVSIRACPACGQRFADVFTERIDWVNGEDPQSCVVVPITAEESDQLTTSGGNVRLIETFGRNRRYLRWNYPSDQGQSVGWAEGNLWIGPHD